MNGPEFTAKQHIVEVNVAEIVDRLVGIANKEKEKAALLKLLAIRSEHDVEIVRILAEYHAESSRQLLDFCERRIEGYRDADWFRRFVRFWARRKLEAEAVRRGMEDTSEMAKEISFIENEDIRGWLQGRRQSMGLLTGALLNLVSEDNPVSLEGVRQFLEGEQI